MDSVFQINNKINRFHVTSIFNKLGVDNRVQAVTMANQLDML